MNELKELLRKLVAFHTVKDDEQSMHEALDFVATFVTERGMHVARYESGGHESLVATVRPDYKTPKLMLAAHLDVIAAPDELFIMREENGQLYGRGVLDMKFAIAAYLQLIDELQDKLDQYDIGLMITTDEEAGGMHGTTELIKEGYIPKACILPDGGDNWQIQTNSKGFIALRLEAYGTPAHGARPWMGKNALPILYDTIQEIERLFPENRADTNTINLGRLEGGSTHNQVADYATALLDIRVINEAEKVRLLNSITTICAARTITQSILALGDAGEFSLDNPYIKHFSELVTKVTGVVVTGSRTIGSSDARFFSTEGVPCISLYPEGGGHHGPEEWIKEQALLDFKKILTIYVEDIARAAIPTNTAILPVTDDTIATTSTS